MRHHSTQKKFRRERGVRIAFFRSLAEALITREKILTTEARAKVTRSFVETLITKAKTGTLAARRQIISQLGGRESVAKKLMDMAPRFKDRKGGYTRITKVAKKASDGRAYAVLELL